LKLELKNTIQKLIMLEKQNIEWKESWRSEYFEYISAFANAEGGRIYIGINDKGVVVGVSDYEKLLVNLPNQIRDLVGVLCEVNHLTEAEKHYIEIVVNPFSVPISYKGKYYIRSGSTTQLLNGNSLNEFLLKKTGLNWDEVIEPSATINDIDQNAIEYFKNSANMSGRLSFANEDNNYMNILKNLRLVDENKHFKRAGLLLFGKDPLKYFISAFVKIGRFGDSGSELLNQDVVEKNVFELADAVLEILDKKYFTKSISYEGLQRIEKTEYPYPAIREILLNAIAHRVYQTTPITVRIYSDRLEIWNLGALPKELSAEDLKQRQK
jgi:ATP-dependent DNA helicase RecG